MRRLHRVLDIHDKEIKEIGNLINKDNIRIRRAIKKLEDAKKLLTSDYTTDMNISAMLTYQILLLEKTSKAFEDRYKDFEKLYGVTK